MTWTHQDTADLLSLCTLGVLAVAGGKLTTSGSTAEGIIGLLLFAGLSYWVIVHAEILAAGIAAAGKFFQEVKASVTR